MRTVKVADVDGRATLVRMSDIAVFPSSMSSPIPDEPPVSENTHSHPRSLTSLPDILSCLSLYQSEEAELSNSLSELLSSREPILASLSRLQDLLPHLDNLLVDASLLSEKVSSTAQTAQRVGGRVRSLDEEMRRVRESGERVGQVMELKVISLLGIIVRIHMFIYSWLCRLLWRRSKRPLTVKTGNLQPDIVPEQCRSLPK